MLILFSNLKVTNFFLSSFSILVILYFFIILFFKIFCPTLITMTIDRSRMKVHITINNNNNANTNITVSILLFNFIKLILLIQHNSIPAMIATLTSNTNINSILKIFL